MFIHFTLHSVPPAIYALAYGTSSLLLNLTATGLIAGRLLFHRHRVVKQLGSGHGQHYVSIAAVVVESAAIYTGFLTVVIVAYAIGSPATNMLQQVIEPVQVRPCFCTRLLSRIRTGTKMHSLLFAPFTWWWGIVDLFTSHHSAGRTWGGVDDVDPDGAGVCGCILVEYTRWGASGAERDSAGGAVGATGRGGGLVGVAGGGRKKLVVFKFERTTFEGVRCKSNETSKSNGLDAVDDLDWHMNTVRSRMSVCWMYNQAVLVVKKVTYQLNSDPSSGNHDRATTVMVTQHRRGTVWQLFEMIPAQPQLSFPEYVQWF